MRTPDDHSFVFIGGLHRSGTTLLFRILRDYPSISGFRFPHGAEREHEGQHLQTVYPAGKAHGGPGYFGLNPDAHFTETTSLATDKNALRLFEEWSAHWDLSKPFLLEKSPPNLVMTRFLQELFPNSFFLVMVRHPIPVSLATIKWMGWPKYVVSHDEAGENYTVRSAGEDDWMLSWQSEHLHFESTIYTLFRNWKAAHETFVADSEYLRHVLALRYEDLVSHPGSTLLSIEQFLGLPVSEARAFPTIHDHNARYFAEWETRKLNAGFRRLLQDEFGEVLSAFGYNISGSHPSVVEWDRSTHFGASEPRVESPSKS
ncbi:MAG TPA: sulfotransferase [Rhodothermales bacterium]|nr:sulfotransferase [Rhodothermales bacterium]